MTSNMTPTNVFFTVSRVMNVVGIGYIITGNPINGDVKPGAIIKSDNHEHSFVVNAVEHIEYAERENPETALILEDVKVDGVELLLAIEPGQVLVINLS